MLQAAECLQCGGIVAIPTETFYGLAVDPFNEKALQALFRLKRREATKAILVLISDIEKLSLVAGFVPTVYKSLVERFWPGPLTLIFPGAKNLSSLLTGGTGNIGVRISANAIATQLCRVWGKPITATSANISGKLPAQSAHEVKEMFGSSVDIIIDGGITPGEASSTVVGIREGHVELIREGQIDFRLIQQTVDSYEYHKSR